MATSKFYRYFQAAGSPLITANIWLVPQANSYPAGALALTPHGTRNGIYYRDNVPDGEYKVYIDPAGGSSPTLYEEKLWIGEQRITGLAEHFDPAESYKIKPTGLKRMTKTVLSLTSPTPDFIGQPGEGLDGKRYVAISLSGTMWHQLSTISDGLNYDSNQAIKIDTDEVTITIGTNKIKLKDLGITNGKIADSQITIQKLAQSLIDYINAAGGGTITNNPDNITLDVNGSQQIKIKDDYKAKIDESARNKGWFLDSVSGSDSNDGKTTLTPFASFAKLETIVKPGDKILLKRGSVFQEEFRMTDTAKWKDVEIDCYGRGKQLPLIDGSKQQANGNFSKTGGYTNIYQTTFTQLLSTGSNNSYPGAWEDDVYLTEIRIGQPGITTEAQALTAVDATPGSFYTPWPFTSQNTIYYIHASDSSDITTNQKTYEMRNLDKGIYCTSLRMKISHIHIRRVGGHNGAVDATDLEADGLIITECARHASIIRGGHVKNSIAAFANPEYSGAMFHSNEVNAPGMTFENCIAIGSLDDTVPLNNGFYTHGALNSRQEVMSYHNCIAINCLWGVINSEVIHCNIQGFKVINCQGMAQLNQYNGASYTYIDETRLTINDFIFISNTTAMTSGTPNQIISTNARKNYISNGKIYVTMPRGIWMLSATTSDIELENVFFFTDQWDTVSATSLFYNYTTPNVYITLKNCIFAIFDKGTRLDSYLFWEGGSNLGSWKNISMDNCLIYNFRMGIFSNIEIKGIEDLQAAFADVTNNNISYYSRTVYPDAIVMVGTVSGTYDFVFDDFALEVNPENNVKETYTVLMEWVVASVTYYAGNVNGTYHTTLYNYGGSGGSSGTVDYANKTIHANFQVGQREDGCHVKVTIFKDNSVLSNPKFLGSPSNGDFMIAKDSPYYDLDDSNTGRQGFGKAWKRFLDEL